MEKSLDFPSKMRKNESRQKFVNLQKKRHRPRDAFDPGGDKPKIRNAQKIRISKNPNRRKLRVLVLIVEENKSTIFISIGGDELVEW